MGNHNARRHAYRAFVGALACLAVVPIGWWIFHITMLDHIIKDWPYGKR